MHDAGPTERTWPFNTDVTLKQATQSLGDVHKTELGREYLRSWGMNPTDAEAHAVADLASGMGRKPSELPMQKIGVADNSGQIHSPPDDLHPYTAEHGGNIREVTKAQGNFREVMAAAEAEQIAELEQQAREIEWARLQGEQPQESPAQTAQSEPRPAVQSQLQPADPTMAERAAIAQEQQRLAELRRLSVDEVRTGRPGSRTTAFISGTPFWSSMSGPNILMARRQRTNAMRSSRDSAPARITASLNKKPATRGGLAVGPAGLSDTIKGAIPPGSTAPPAEVFGVIETALRSHFARAIEP